ncbi:MAG TPA: hypothetical protein VK943_06765 [Arenibaculum sp.]|nr:hypothetical protein [Arenibaculum sp.]
MDKSPLLKALGALAIGTGVALTQSPAGAADRQEAVAYDDAMNSSGPEALRAFLRTYPDSPLAGQVFSRLMQLAQAPAEPSPEELAAFEAAMAADDPEMLVDFLRLYPLSPLADAAAARLTELGVAPPPTGPDDFFSSEPMIY